MAICEQSIQGNSPTSTCFAADFLAKASRLRDGVSVSEIQEELYYFWSKCEWEVLVTPWISPRESEKKKIDVCWQIMNNWDVFVDYTWANRKKL